MRAPGGLKAGGPAGLLPSGSASRWVVAGALILLALSADFGRPAHASDDQALWQAARRNGAALDELFRRSQRLMNGWLAHADGETLLLPERLPGLVRGKANDELIYTPNNSAADVYPYLVISSFLIDPALHRGRMMEMLRNEVLYTTRGGAIPGSLDLKTRKLGPPSLFGASEYAKDGLVPITELLGRTPWFFRMADIMEELMERSPVRTRYGNLPSRNAEMNGNVLQVLARLIPMTGDRRFLQWAGQIEDAYLKEVLPANGYLPGSRWDFDKKTDRAYTSFRDHGNELIPGLVLLHAVETEMGLERAEAYRPVIRKMLDRILESANPDGMLYNKVRSTDLKPLDENLSDNWGYVYAAVYAFYQVSGEEKYRWAVLRVLGNLGKYRGYDWEHGSMDGYADSIEGALYLVAREPVPEALDWIESEMKVLLAGQRADGLVEGWVGDGNWLRTVLLYAFMKTQGCYARDWKAGLELGAASDGGRLYLTLHAPFDWAGNVVFDGQRHRRVLNFRKNYARLNEWPEWYTVRESSLYRIEDPDSGIEATRLGSELRDGFALRVPAGKTVRLMVSPVPGGPQ